MTVATFAGMDDQVPQEGVEDLYLFDPKVIDQVDLTRAKCTFNPPVHSARDPAPGVQLRPLSSKDYDRGRNVKYVLHYSFLCFSLYLCGIAAI